MYVDVLQNFDLGLMQFCPHTTHQYTNFIKKKHIISLKLDGFHLNLLKVHSVYDVNWVLFLWWKPPITVPKLTKKNTPKGKRTHKWVYNVNVGTIKLCRYILHGKVLFLKAKLCLYLGSGKNQGGFSPQSSPRHASVLHA